MFYNPAKPPTLDCELCGEVVRTLTQKEYEEVAHNPYNFIVYCSPAHRAAGRDMDARRDGLNV